MKLPSTLLLCAIGFICGCVGPANTKESITYSAERSLGFSDERIANKGAAFVKYGSIRRGSFPQDSEKPMISFLEELLRSEGFTIVGDERSADYALEVNDSGFQKADGNRSLNIYVTLTRCIHDPRELIENLGYKNIRMWHGKAEVVHHSKRSLASLERPVVQQLMSLFPSPQEPVTVPLQQIIANSGE